MVSMFLFNRVNAYSETIAPKSYFGFFQPFTFSNMVHCSYSVISGPNISVYVFDSSADLDTWRLSNGTVVPPTAVIIQENKAAGDFSFYTQSDGMYFIFSNFFGTMNAEVEITFKYNVIPSFTLIISIISLSGILFIYFLWKFRKFPNSLIP